MNQHVEPPEPPRSKAVLLRSAVILVLAAGTVAACLVLSPPIAHSEAGIQMSLPDTLSGFTGTDHAVSEAELKILPEDTAFAKKIYSNGEGRDISCQVVLAGAEKRSIHRPEICLPGQGWVITSSEVIPIPLEGGGTLSVTQLNIARPVALANGETRQLRSLFMYWFVGKDTTTPHHMVRILKSNLDILFHNTNHRWAYVIVSAPVLQGFTPDGQSEPEVQAMLTAFIADLVPHIMDPAKL